jgi:hypothetical protein
MWNKSAMRPTHVGIAFFVEELLAAAEIHLTSSTLFNFHPFFNGASLLELKPKGNFCSNDIHAF